MCVQVIATGGADAGPGRDIHRDGDERSVVQLYKQATGPSRGVGGTEENADLIHEAPRWYPSLLVFRKKLAGAAAIPGGSLPAAARFACGPISLTIAAWGHGGDEAPMLIFKEALEIFVYRCFAYLLSGKYVFLF